MWPQGTTNLPEPELAHLKNGRNDRSLAPGLLCVFSETIGTSAQSLFSQGLPGYEELGLIIISGIIVAACGRLITDVRNPLLLQNQRSEGGLQGVDGCLAHLRQHLTLVPTREGPAAPQQPPDLRGQLLLQNLVAADPRWHRPLLFAPHSLSHT